MKNPRLITLILMTIERFLLKEITTDKIIVEFDKKKKKYN